MGADAAGRPGPWSAEPWRFDAGLDGAWQITASDEEGTLVLCQRPPWEHRKVESWANGGVMASALELLQQRDELLKAARQILRPARGAAETMEGLGGFRAALGAELRALLTLDLEPAIHKAEGR